MDNATNQKTPAVRRTLEELFSGRFSYCAQYSPNLKPVERCFKLVKAYIGDHETRAVINPLEVINEAFQLYERYNGQKAGVFYELWSLYAHGYNDYLNS